MRQRFEQQLSLGTVPISDIKIPTKSRYEMPVPFLSRNVTQKGTDTNDGTWSSMSFVLYLVHWPILKMYTTTVLLQGEKYKLLYLFLFYITSLLVAYLITTRVDRYFESIRRKWLSKQEKKMTLVSAIFNQQFSAISLQTNNKVNILPFSNLFTSL